MVRPKTFTANMQDRADKNPMGALLPQEWHYAATWVMDLAEEQGVTLSLLGPALTVLFRASDLNPTTDPWPLAKKILEGVVMAARAGEA